jgi:hypothetical protein
MGYVACGRFMAIRILFLVAFFTFAGCLARPIVKMDDPEIHEKQNEVIIRSVLENARTGDWLAIRGYHVTDELVANVTGTPITHAAVYDSRSHQVIEAEGNGVHVSGLDDFVDKSYRLLIIRPRWQSDENMNLVWDEAEKLVGKSYDLLGTIGFNFPSRYYCSELAISIYKKWYKGNEKFPKVIKPGDLYLYGNVVYDSLPRDEL